MPFCNICKREANGAVERAKVRSNVRKFSAEEFELWRCPFCRSLHAADDVDLAYYYADYPFHKLGGNDLDWMLSAMYRALLARVRRHGFMPGQSMLDYGCGSGQFLTFCKQQGYENVAGYDAYSANFADESVLSRKYDVVMSQDVLEHVESPREHLQTLTDLAKPGGLIVIGTPNASDIDLSNPEPRIHALHQPYHRHIASEQALRDMGSDMGWTLKEFFPSMYSNTPLPFANARFVQHYFRCFDNNIDLALEPMQVGSWKIWTPLTLFWALFGYFFAPESDVMVIFSAPHAQLPDTFDHRS